MGLFSRNKKKEGDDFDKDFSSPPDFSKGFDDPFGGKDPLQNDFSYDQQASQGLPSQGQNYPGQGQPGQDPSTFDHDIFSSQQPTEATNARAYAQQLSPQAQPGQQPSYGGAITGHESQLILERLDTIKAELDSIKQRMMRIERFVEQTEQKQTSGRRYY